MHHLYKHSSLRGDLLYVWFLAMHTRVDLMLCGRQSENELLLTASEVREEILRLERMANCYDEQSELAVLNRTAALCPQPVSPELFKMISFCVESYGRTGGYFDITVHSESHAPDTLGQLHFSSAGHTLYFARPGIRINLSGFLKGYALDRVGELLRSNGVTDALVNMGNSSVLALGCPPFSEGWKVDFGSRLSCTPGGIQLCNECLTTSGNDSAERRHIIDPRTGKLMEGKRQVAVVTIGGAVGEVLSTALFVADEAGRRLMEENYHPRLIVDS